MKTYGGARVGDMMKIDASTLVNGDVVILTKLHGSFGDRNTYFTPTEARAIAAELIRLADDIEGKL